MLPAMVRVDFTKDASGGAIQATVVFTAPDGTVYEESEPVGISAGNSLNIGPLQLPVVVDCQHSYGPTDQGGGQAQPRPAAPAAAPKPGAQHVPGRR